MLAAVGLIAAHGLYTSLLSWKAVPGNHQCFVVSRFVTCHSAAQAVAVQGAHKGYQLQAADLTCSAMSELSVYNVRRLFANRGYEAMDLRHQFVGKKPTEGRWPKIANAVIDP